MTKSTGRRLKVWSWDGRDSVSLKDLEFVVACPARAEVHKHSVRLRLPKPISGQYTLVKESDDVFEVALEQPGRVYWRDTELGLEWRDEAELETVRRASTAWHTGTPLHRPDPG